jgi:uncharacterized protein (DUF927 family)
MTENNKLGKRNSLYFIGKNTTMGGGSKKVLNNK